MSDAILAPKCLLCREPRVAMRARVCEQCRARGKAGATAATKFAARVAAATFGAFLEREHPVVYDTLREAHTNMRRAQYEAAHPEVEILDAKVIDFKKKGGRPRAA